MSSLGLISLICMSLLDSVSDAAVLERVVEELRSFGFLVGGDCSAMLRTILARRDDGGETAVLVSLEVVVFFGITNVACCNSQYIILLYSSTAPSIFTREPTL